MGYKASVTESAERDIDEILSYLAVKLANPKAAGDFATSLEEKYRELASYPLMFERSCDARHAQKGYHRFMLGSYIVLYTVNEVQQEVIIARAFYGRRNYEKYI